MNELLSENQLDLLESPLAVEVTPDPVHHECQHINIKTHWTTLDGVRDEYSGPLYDFFKSAYKFVEDICNSMSTAIYMRLREDAIFKNVSEEVRDKIISKIDEVELSGANYLNTLSAYTMKYDPTTLINVNQIEPLVGFISGIMQKFGNECRGLPECWDKNMQSDVGLDVPTFH